MSLKKKLPLLDWMLPGPMHTSLRLFLLGIAVLTHVCPPVGDARQRLLAMALDSDVVYHSPQCFVSNVFL
jgi:hypothetical protein